VALGLTLPAVMSVVELCSPEKPFPSAAPRILPPLPLLTPTPPEEAPASPPTPLVVVLPSPLPTPAPSPSVESTRAASDETDEPQPPRRHRHRPVPGDPNEGRWGRKIWHNDGGHWRWYYAHRPPWGAPVLRAQPAVPVPGEP
jgi:hypothetical protein